MEKIIFKYVFSDDGSDEKIVKTVKNNPDGLTVDEVCEMFLDFMEAAGYTSENIIKYFR